MLPTPPLTPSMGTTGLPEATGAAGSSARRLSDNELSYYLPARADGANDMYVHHGLRASALAMSLERVDLAWALQLARHPLLASRVAVGKRGYSDVWFAYTPPTDVAMALEAAAGRLQYLDPKKGAADVDLVDAYLNKGRTLSDDMLACLIVRRGTRQVVAVGPNGPTASDGDDQMVDYEVMLCTTHYVGDGMALHTFMNQLYGLLGGDLSDGELQTMLEAELLKHNEIPPPLEDRLGLSHFQTAVGHVAQRTADANLLGGQVLPALKGRERETIVPTKAYTPEQTKAALARCKAHGVTIAHVVFALCAVAWSRRQGVDATQPTMMYSALNMRPHMNATPTPPSFFHLAVGYFNIVLPTLTLASERSPAEMVWYRAASTKAQTAAAAKSPLAAAMFRATASMRAARARHWARIDDAVAATAVTSATAAATATLHPPTPEKSDDSHTDTDDEVLPPAPAGRAFMGLSMLGNLDAMYKHASFPRIRMYALTTGSRQRPGGLLLFAYTLAGKLWLSLGYDHHGFETGVIESFWADVLALADDVFLGPEQQV